MAAAAALNIECPACHISMRIPVALDIDGRDGDLINVSIHPDLTEAREHASEHGGDNA